MFTGLGHECHKVKKGQCGARVSCEWKRKDSFFAVCSHGPEVYLMIQY